MTQEKKINLDIARWIGLGITLIGIFISIGIFINKVASADIRQQALEIRVQKLENINSEVLTRLTGIETLLNQRLPKY